MRSTTQGTAEYAGIVPPGGDNVTEQQILDTMRALQAEVAASRADNVELRRANEELRRDLQQVGEHATDERAPPVPLRARPMPFSQAIMNTALPTMSRPESLLHRSRGPRGPSHGVPHPNDAYRRV